MIDYIYISELFQTFSISFCVIGAIATFIGFLLFVETNPNFKTKIIYAICSLIITIFISTVIMIGGLASDMKIANKTRADIEYRKREDLNDIRRKYLREKVKELIYDDQLKNERGSNNEKE